MSNPSQLLLLADHIKLSLLERQRAHTLNLNPNNTQDTNISRSLESFKKNLDSLSATSTDHETISNLRSQYEDLLQEFRGTDTNDSSTTTTQQPNTPALANDFDRAQSKPSTTKPRIQPDVDQNPRFRDNPTSDDENENDRAALFTSSARSNQNKQQQPYTDNPPSPPDPTSQMTNQQIHAYHSDVLAEQDAQLDTLSQSIGRQRYLGMQISDELEGQIALLDEVDRGVDRHQGRLDGAQRRLRGVGQRAKDNWGITTIVILIVVLVLLIVVLK